MYHNKQQQHQNQNKLSRTITVTFFIGNINFDLFCFHLQIKLTRNQHEFR